MILMLSYMYGRARHNPLFHEVLQDSSENPLFLLPPIFLRKSQKSRQKKTPFTIAALAVQDRSYEGPQHNADGNAKDQSAAEVKMEKRQHLNSSLRLKQTGIFYPSLEEFVKKKQPLTAIEGRRRGWLANRQMVYLLEQT